MAYSRFGFSDIYMYPSVFDTVTCSGCFIYNTSVDFDNDEELLAHIKEHRDAGHDIPSQLEYEILSDSSRYGAGTPEMLQ